ncbi:MAG: ABC transporter ATP-binding protein [Actinobacteria bacterium]|nr:MAG: ABC transporter ATP-binding protein [Actinomycetota bacterium]
MFELRGVSRYYGGGTREVRAVDAIDLRIDPGEFLVVAGPSGSGKTTLLQLLGALDRPTEGEILFERRDLARLPDAELTQLRLETIGFVFQQFNLIPTLTARQNVEVALAPQRLSRSEREDRVSELLEAVGLGPRGEHLPSELSGGEQQRVSIARALANRPRILLADEPTGNLDSATGEEIVALLRSISDQRGEAVVLITHDASIAARAGRVVRMQDGRLLEPVTPADLTEATPV